MNALDSGEMFTLELMNPDITLRTGKGGPRWRFHADITQEEALLFANADLAGMILEMQGRVVERHSDAPVDNKRPPGGPISKNAGQKCNEPEANEFAKAQGFDNFKAMIYRVCAIESRAELDSNEEAAKKYETLRHRYFRWAAP